jgi:dihydrofolate reductase
LLLDSGVIWAKPVPGVRQTHLVDEINLLAYPLVIGEGIRLFPDTGQDIALDLVDSRVTRKGVTIQVYRHTGRPQYATAAM